MARRLDDIRLAVLMLDGIDLKGRCNLVALGPMKALAAAGPSVSVYPSDRVRTEV